MIRGNTHSFLPPPQNPFPGPGEPLSQQEHKNTFIHNLLHGTLADNTATVREANTFALDLDTPRAVILIDASDYIIKSAVPSDETQFRRRAQLVIGHVVRFFHLPNDTICSYLGDGEVAVLKASNTRDLATWAPSQDTAPGAHSPWTNLAALKRASETLLSYLHANVATTIGIGIGRYHPGVRGIARSYQDARAALTLGSRCRGPNRVYCLDGLGTAAFIGVSDETTKMELAAHLLSPLDHEPELLETLRTFFSEDCCPSTTARRLAIHRNTLAYRLQKIASLTGLDPRHFDEATQMHLALFIRSLEGRS